MPASSVRLIGLAVLPWFVLLVGQVAVYGDSAVIIQPKCTTEVPRTACVAAAQDTDAEDCRDTIQADGQCTWVREAVAGEGGRMATQTYTSICRFRRLTKNPSHAVCADSEKHKSPCCIEAEIISEFAVNCERLTGAEFCAAPNNPPH